MARSRRRGRPPRWKAEEAGQLRLALDAGMETVAHAEQIVRKSRSQQRRKPQKAADQLLLRTFSFVTLRQNEISGLQREINVAVDELRDARGLAA